MSTKKEIQESLELIHQRMGRGVKLKDITGPDHPSVPYDGKTEVTGLITDSRRVTPNSAFFALPGLRTNGNEYLEEALERGAKVVVSETEELDLPLGVTGLKVEDSRLALAEFAKRYHGCPDSSLRMSV